MAWLPIDSTVIKVHKHVAGAPLKKGPNIPKPGPLPWWVHNETPRRERRLGPAVTPYIQPRTGT